MNREDAIHIGFGKLSDASMPKKHVNFIQIIQKCVKILFKNYGNAVVNSYMDWSFGFYVACSFVLGTIAIGQVPWDNGHEAVLMGQLS